MDLERLVPRAAVHAALGDPHRLAIVDELAWSDRSPSMLASRLDIGSNLLAHHLAILEEAGVVERVRSSGDRRRRYVRLVPGALSTAVPRPDLVARHVLFVCSANSARSQLAAAAWNARHEVKATSAGTHPAARVRPEAVRTAARFGLDIRDARPRSIDQVVDPFDLVITVCDVALEELPRDATQVHWSIPDPVPAGTAAAYDAALRGITARIEILAPHVRLPRRARRSHP
jgi:protein-tyrosine-phosphatase/DNA-binding HxlR family transcriptional regulator